MKRLVLLSSALLLLASPARAVSITLGLDPALSSLGAESLTGALSFDIGALPVIGTTSFDMSQVNLTSSGSTNIQLDSGVTNPGLGVIDAAGSFLIPSLFVTVDGSSNLTIVDVTGSVVFGPGGDTIQSLSSVFVVDATTVTIFAIPEPSTFALVALGLVGLGAARARRMEGTR